ncbi:hypothetical protein ACNKU7_12230 [Microbulbifer sp. SA54]|uniref:hypothetical protein n=1 Tax=Microbulbifer sp. SA54 TaxID=3401577 RepID=UPI003AAF671A
MAYIGYCRAFGLLAGPATGFKNGADYSSDRQVFKGHTPWDMWHCLRSQRRFTADNHH